MELNERKATRHMAKRRDPPSRKCQTFAMCGTGSDSKAGENTSVAAVDARDVMGSEAD